MKILMLATEDYLGAGKASLRIYNALKEDHKVALLVKNKVNNNDPFILKYEDLVIKKKFVKVASSILRRVKSLFLKELKTNPDYYFFGLNENFQYIDTKAILHKLPFIPNIILVTWTSRFLNSKSIYLLQKATDAQIIFYPMDMSAFTGGCHYAWECEGYKKDCSNCPAILNINMKGKAKANLKEKIHYFNYSKSFLIVGSEQLYLEAKQSRLFKDLNNIAKARIPIDGQIFNRNVRSLAKVVFGIPDDSLVIFFGASVTNEKRKGFNLFIETLKILFESESLDYLKKEKIVILLGGNISESDFISDIPFKTFFTGYINDDRLLSIAYQASTLFVTTSIQDSGPMMINEAIMCGTPVVSFSIGVAEDLIFNGKSGYKVEVGNTKMLSDSMEQILKLEHDLFEELSINSHEIGIMLTSKEKFKSDFNKIINELELKRV